MPGPKKPFVKAERGSDQNTEPLRKDLGLIHQPKHRPQKAVLVLLVLVAIYVFFVNRAQIGRVQKRDRARTEERKNESRDRRRHNGRPIVGDVLGVAPHGDRRSGAGSEFVCSENGRDGHSGQQNQHGGNLDQPAAAHDRIDEAGEQRKRAEKKDHQV